MVGLKWSSERNKNQHVPTYFPWLCRLYFAESPLKSSEEEISVFWNCLNLADIRNVRHSFIFAVSPVWRTISEAKVSSFASITVTKVCRNYMEQYGVVYLPQCAPRFCPICGSKPAGPCSHRQVSAHSSAVRSSSVSHTCTGNEAEKTLWSPFSDVHF